MNSPASMPPKFFHRFFRWYCHPKLVDHIEGDLLEVYGRRVKQMGKRKADLKFIIDVLLLFRKGIIKPTEGYQRLNSYGMYKSYFTIGWRNLLRNKGYSIINIGGLAIGMMVAILNGLWVWHELSYNTYFEKYDRIAQVAESGVDHQRGTTYLNTTMTYPLSTELIEKYGQHFKRITRMTFQSEKILTTGEIRLTARGIYADESAPEMFSLKMISGTRSGLRDLNSIMVSESLAASLFGNEDPVGKVLRMNSKSDVTVTGVFEDFPQNTQFFEVRFFTPWSLYLAENKWIEARALSDWRNHFMKIYVELPEGQGFGEVTARIQPALQFHSEDAERAKERKQVLQLYPMSEWHLHPERLGQGQLDPVTMIKLMAAIGIFVLVLACINFVNLSTARAEKRAKEIGIRKTIGSVRRQLVAQFYSESFIVTLLGFIFAITLTGLFLPGFNEVASQKIEFPSSNVWFWLSGFVFILFTSILAGFYPALYLSSFNPIQALKGTFRMGRLASMPRKVLVVVQFSISLILIIGTMVVEQQIRFARNRPVGYDRDGLVMIQKRTSDFSGKYEVLRSELKNTGVVYEVSESMGPTTEIYSNNNGWAWKGQDANFDESFSTLSVSHLHGKTVGWQFVDGRDFDLNNPGDSSGIVITESVLASMKQDHPIGEPVSWTWWSDKSKVIHYKILGVIRDMVMESPYGNTRPTIFYLKGHNGSPSWINIKINPQFSASEALPKIENVFKKIIPSVPFDYKFADEEYAKKFGKEERIGYIASIFATLAIFISCLGLLGLVSFVAETRTKEIGIRKVLGATVMGLWSMLSKDFAWLVLIACLIATPLAYKLMDNWLEKFTYRIEIPLWIFSATAIGTVAVALLTVSYQAIRTATMNPVNALRSE